MRIIAGAWRGRLLQVPPGEATRPTADRVRQALFDRLMHAPWASGPGAGAGGPALAGARVLDAFAGTGALGLEALSRGAAEAVFLECDPAALRTLRANVAACGAEARCRVLAADALHPPRKPPLEAPFGLVFLDPPYRLGLAGPAVSALHAAQWLAEGALAVLETGRDEAAPELGEVLARFEAGAAAVTVFRLG